MDSSILHRKYAVIVDKPGWPEGFELCLCESAESAAAVVRALLETGDDNLVGVKVLISRIH